MAKCPLCNSENCINMTKKLYSVHEQTCSTLHQDLKTTKSYIIINAPLKEKQEVKPKTKLFGGCTDPLAHSRLQVTSK